MGIRMECKWGGHAYAKATAGKLGLEFYDRLPPSIAQKERRTGRMSGKGVWIPACAGMTAVNGKAGEENTDCFVAALSRNDKEKAIHPIPYCLHTLPVLSSIRDGNAGQTGAV